MGLYSWSNCHVANLKASMFRSPDCMKLCVSLRPEPQARSLPGCGVARETARETARPKAAKGSRCCRWSRFPFVYRWLSKNKEHLYKSMVVGILEQITWWNVLFLVRLSFENCNTTGLHSIANSW